MGIMDYKGKSNISDSAECSHCEFKIEIALTLKQDDEHAVVRFTTLHDIVQKVMTDHVAQAHPRKVPVKPYPSYPFKDIKLDKKEAF